jgi:rare lipoprotein A
MRVRGAAAAAAAAALLAACGTPSRPGAPSSPAGTSAPAPAPARGGAFYQDDGPPDRIPPDLANIPDAVPRVEDFNRATSRPYVALGRSYTPLVGDVAFRQRGMASWYGKQFHGNRTANGEIYDMFGMTAAHPTLPIPSYVRVTNLRNGRSVIVRVNDRGPFKHDRVIDLSYAAATKLGYAAAGTGEVEVERITLTQIASGEWRRGARTEVAAAPAPTTAAAATVPVPTAVVVPVGAAAASGAVPSLPPNAASAPAATTTVAAGASASAPLRGWSVQLGAFAQQANAEALAGRAAALLAFLDPDALDSGQPRIEKDGAVFRVLLGATTDRSSAQALARELERVLERPTTLVLR